MWPNPSPNNVSEGSWILSIWNCVHFIKFEGKLKEVEMYKSHEADFVIHSSQPGMEFNVRFFILCGPGLHMFTNRTFSPKQNHSGHFVVLEMQCGLLAALTRVAFFTACKDSCSHNMPLNTPSHKRISSQTSATLSSMRCHKIRHVPITLWKALLCALSAENKQTPLPWLSINCYIIQSSRQQKRLVSSVFRKDQKHKDYEAQVGGRVDSVAPGACYFLRNSCKSAIMPQNNGFQRLMTILCF